MIRITNGTYGYFDGKKIMPRTAADGAFSLAPGKEARLVRLGMAKYVDKSVNLAVSSEPIGEPPAYDIGMKLEELKRIALEGYGVDASKATSKAKVIELIELPRAQQTYADEESTDPDADNKDYDEEPPKLNAAPPIDGDGDA